MGAIMRYDPDIEEIIGQPSENAPRALKDLGPMHQFLLAACPRGEKDLASIPKIARLLEVSSHAVYKWIKQGFLTQARAEQIAALPGCRKTLAEFTPFVKKEG